MGKRRWTALAVLAASLLAPAFDGEDRRPRAQVVPHARAGEPDPALRELAARLEGALDRALPLFERETGLELPPDQLVVLHLYEHVDDYRVALARAGVTGFRDTGSATAWSDLQSHVVVQPRAEPAYLAAVGGMPEMTLQLALHEAAHQLVWRSDDFSPAYLPAWYSEGQAEHLAELAMAAELDRAPCEPLRLADGRNQLARALDAGRHVPLPDLFAHGFEAAAAERDRDLVYHQSRSLYAFLADPTSGRWHAALLDFQSRLARLAPLRGVSRAAGLSAVDAVWRDCAGDLAALERAWSTGARERCGPWLERWRGSQWRGDELVSASVSWFRGSLALTEDAPGRAAFRVACELAPIELAARGEEPWRGTARIALQVAPDELVELHVSADGDLGLVHRRDGLATALATSSGPALPREGWTAAALEVRGERLLARVGAHELEAALPAGARPGQGPWGVGAQRGAVRFRAMRVEPVD